jgi:hypothetical protein
MPAASILAAALAALTAAGCGESASSVREYEKLAAEKDALEAEVRQIRGTVERLEAEVRTLLAENVELKNKLESTSLELETAKSRRSDGFEERVVVVENPPSEDEASGADSNRPLPFNPIDEDTGLQVLEASAKATERNRSWWRFGWVVSIENHSSEERDFSLQLQFMDKDGFVVDEDTEQRLTLAPYESRTFRESALINAGVAPHVASVNPVIKN